ncbi:MAG: GNAT family N-acetyltransferase [Bacteroidetes bacterium]|nr:GNAT family N-acetyltransferase [Bacteroidota bacterium]
MSVMNPEMLIRDYNPADYSRVEALWKETGIYTVERGDTSEIILRCNKAGGKFLVLEDRSDNSVAGTSWMTWDGRRVLLHHFAIRPSLQNQGYGRKLAIESLAFARELNCPMKLEVHRDNVPAVKLYRSLEFLVFEDYDIYLIIDP